MNIVIEGRAPISTEEQSVVFVFEDDSERLQMIKNLEAMAPAEGRRAIGYYPDDYFTSPEEGMAHLRRAVATVNKTELWRKGKTNG